MLSESVRKLRNLTQELRIGITTRGAETTQIRPESVHYATIDYASTQRILDRLDIKPTDTFVDVGAGKGRVLCFVARRRLEKVLGVEYDPRLADSARSNVEHMRGKVTAVEVRTQAAEDFDYSGVTVLYFFNPFEASVLDLVLAKLDADRQGRDVRLAFVMESPAQREVFAKHAWLECYDRWIETQLPVALYRTRQVVAP